MVRITLHDQPVRMVCEPLLAVPHYINFFNIYFMEVQAKGSTALFIIGMAGSGKTTLVTNFSKDTHKTLRINLDPAVLNLPYQHIFDIRQHFHFKQVMKDYGLGPNGAIMTALNLMSAQLDRLMNIVRAIQQEKTMPVLYLIDVPGQIQAFSWSASSIIFAKAFQCLMPTALLFVLDLFRCQNPNSFLSNVLFAQSIKVRLQLPLIVVLNKSDCVINPQNQEWLKDYTKFDEVLNKQNNYLATLSKSVVLYMSDFFQELVTSQISALKRLGMDQLWETVQKVCQNQEKIRKQLEKVSLQ